MSQSCFHCNEPIPAGCKLTIEIDEQLKPVCCTGCQAVAQAILSGGLTQYYKFREQAADKKESNQQNKNIDYQAYDQPSVQAEFVTQGNNNQATADISLEGLHCAACAWLIEKRLNQLDGVITVDVNLTQLRAHISWQTNQVKLSTIFAAIDEIGYQASPFKLSELEANYQKRNRQFMQQLVVSGFFTMQVMMLAFAMYSDVLEAQYDEFFRWISLLLTTPIVVYSGQPILRSALISLKNNSLNMDVPVGLAIVGTYIASLYATLTQTGEVYFESAAMFVFLLLTSRYLEHQVKAKATSISANMLKLLPLVAYKQNQQGQIESVSANSLIKNDIIWVKQGQTIPADGFLVSQAVMVEEALLTGESLPIAKTKGQKLYAGTLVIDHAIKIRVEAAGKATTLAQVAIQQEKISQSRSKFITAADKVAKEATLAVLILALITFLVWQFWLSDNGLWYAVAVLVATCPCALSLALPTALSASASALKQNGILIHNTQAIEQAEKINAIAFDKTGTLTTGQFVIDRIKTIDDLAMALLPNEMGHSKHNATPNTEIIPFSQVELMNWIAHLEYRANHPIASAFKQPQQAIKIEDFTIIAGVGLTAMVNQQKLTIGSKQLNTIALNEDYQDAQIYIYLNEQFVGAIWLKDNLRENAMRSLNLLSLPKYILSGDSSSQLSKIAQQLNMPFWGGLKPQDKVEKLKLLRKQHGYVAMVGDGINDAMVLAEADVSIAMNEASELSKQKADVVLLGSHLDKIALLIKQSKRLNKIIKQNFSWAIGYNLIVLPLAVCGWLTPWMAVIGMSASSLIVVTNSMRLLKI